MPPVAGDTVHFGSAPDPNEFVPGRLWLWGWSTALEPLKLLVNVYAYNPPDAVDWGDRVWEDASAFTVDYAVSGDAPGLWTIEHTYAKASGWVGYVEAGGARARFSAALGDLPVSKARIVREQFKDRYEDAVNQRGIGSGIQRVA